MVKLPLREFDEEEKIMFYGVRRPSGRIHGRLGEYPPLWSLPTGFHLAQWQLPPQWPILPPAPQEYLPPWHLLLPPWHLLAAFHMAQVLGFRLPQGQVPLPWFTLPPAPQGYYPQQPYAQPVQLIQKQQPARSGLGGLRGRGWPYIQPAEVIQKQRPARSGLGGEGGLVLRNKRDDFSDRPGGDGDCGGGCY
ncbi:unnamed protein product [Sphagnum jensenii]|jgi:hypothetical protein